MNHSHYKPQKTRNTCLLLYHWICRTGPPPRGLLEMSQISCPVACLCVTLFPLLTLRIVYNVGFTTFAQDVEEHWGFAFLFVIANWIFAVVAWFRTTCSDPGSVDLDRVRNEEHFDKIVAREVDACPKADTSDLMVATHWIRQGRREIHPNGESIKLPPRSRFCKQTQTHVRRFNHYCVYTRNAIALNNFKFFYQLLLAVTSGAIVNLSLLVAHLYNNPVGSVGSILGAAVLIILVCFWCIFGGMTIYTSWGLLRRNVLFVEQPDIARAWSSGWHSQIYHDKPTPYDQGSLFRNLQATFGEDWWLWWLPTSPSFQDEGYYFRVHYPTFRQWIDLMAANMEAAKKRQAEVQRQHEAKLKQLKAKWEKMGKDPPINTTYQYIAPNLAAGASSETQPLVAKEVSG